MASTISSFSDELASITERVGESVVTVHARHRVPSSGIHWRKGYIVTANHTVRREEDVTILLHGGKQALGALAGRDPGTDLAILKVDADIEVPIADVGDAAALKLANFVLALGRTRQGRLVASGGIVGGLSGEWRTWRGGRVDQNIRLDLLLYAGFSGGPLVGAEGKVMGINTSGLARGRAVAVPASTVNRSVDELIEKGHIARPYLGIAMQPVAIPQEFADQLKSSPGGGLMVMHVEPGGPAAKAGIVMGDILVELGGVPSADTQQVRESLASAIAGKSVSVKVIRAGKPVEMKITLGERPAK
jgi:S1-C subfamily serine protease